MRGFPPDVRETRQIASYLGLAPTPFQSGGMDRDRRINRTGISRARKTLIQLASLWLRDQPESPAFQVGHVDRGRSLVP
jgi:transposase